MRNLEILYTQTMVTNLKLTNLVGKYRTTAHIQPYAAATQRRPLLNFLQTQLCNGIDLRHADM